jgi:hypothetical protein
MKSTNVSEFQLFKLCSEKPQALDLNQLNMTFIKDPAEGGNPAEA